VLDVWGREGFPGIRDAYAKRTAPVGAAIRVRDGERHVEGRLAGFNDFGGLLLETDSGVRKLYSGDVAI